MTAHGVPKFRLRFPPSEITFWADRYAYADDAPVEAIGATARTRGFYTLDEFLKVALWKSPRSKSRCAKNTSSTVEEATGVALRTSDERLRIGVLTLLDGVQLPTASVLLHLGHADPYPIIDYRALWSLSVDPPPAFYSFAFWEAYTRACRSLAAAAGVSMRTLDRALWQYSKEHQPAVGSSAPPGGGGGVTDLSPVAVRGVPGPGSRFAEPPQFVIVGNLNSADGVLAYLGVPDSAPDAQARAVATFALRNPGMIPAAAVRELARRGIVP